MERQGVVETPPSVWKTDVIPLNYWRILWRFSRRCLLSHPTTLKFKGASSLGAKGGSLHYAMSLRTKYTTFIPLSTTFYLISVRLPIFSQATPFFWYPHCRSKTTTDEILAFGFCSAKREQSVCRLFCCRKLRQNVCRMYMYLLQRRPPFFRPPTPGSYPQPLRTRQRVSPYAPADLQPPRQRGAQSTDPALLQAST